MFKFLHHQMGPPRLEILECEEVEEGCNGIATEAAQLLSQAEHFMDQVENISAWLLRSLDFINSYICWFLQPEFSDVSSLSEYRLMVSQVAKCCQMGVDPLRDDVLHVGVTVDAPFLEDKERY
jgi:hypothetical protein